MSTWIKGIGGYLAERVVTSEELEEMAGYKDHGVKLGLCKMRTGCASRHWAAISSPVGMPEVLEAPAPKIKQ